MGSAAPQCKFDPQPGAVHQESILLQVLPWSPLWLVSDSWPGPKKKIEKPKPSNNFSCTVLHGFSSFVFKKYFYIKMNFIITFEFFMPQTQQLKSTNFL